MKIRIHKLNDTETKNFKALIGAIHSPSDEEENMQVNQENECLIIVQSESRSEIEKVLPEVLSVILKIIEVDRKKVNT